MDCVSHFQFQGNIIGNVGSKSGCCQSLTARVIIVPLGFFQGVSEMRIAYLLTSLGVGGAERQALALAERMAARGHTGSLLVLRGRQPEQWPTTLDPVYFGMCRTPAILLAFLCKARRFLRDFQPDLIHSHTYPANMMARLLKILHP